MTDLANKTRSILIEEEFPHAPAVLWCALSDGAIMAKWMMPPKGFAPIVGQHFTFTTKAAGAWDGTIRCQVLRLEVERVLEFSWTGGDAGNVGYGAPLSTTVTMTLTATETGTRLRLEHAGFALPENQVAYDNMSGGWKTVLGRIGAALPQGAAG
jgi:uncharacterized protein YndB with AHSA1/START domain